MSNRAAAAGEGGRREILAKICLSSASAAAAEASTYPIDALKIRLQLHRSPGSGGGVLRVAGELVRDGGLYRGLSPAILRHLFYTPLRIVGYEHLRSSLASGGREVGLLEKAIAGGLSGVAAQVLASPADLIKLRMQADSRLLSQGIQPRYTGILDAFTKIVRAEGFSGLWRGVAPNAQRAFLVNMADVIKTRMMNQGQEAKALYRNSYDCLVKTVKYEGATALWKGFLPTWARLGPWQFVFWVSYEKLRQASGISSF
ncbi:unnamed protein product [Alopecurus aequalis]